jgi:hypothetical protein
MKLFSRTPIIQSNIKAARDRDQKLMALLVRMTAPHCPARYIVNVVNSPEIIGQVPATLHKGQISTVVRNLWQIYQSALFYTSLFHDLSSANKEG